MRAGPLSSPKIIKLLNTHFVNVWVLLREVPELQAGAKGAAAAALATKLRQHYTDSVDILTLTPDLEVLGHLHNMSLFHPYYLPRSERIPRYLKLLKSSAGAEVAAQKPSEDLNEATLEKSIADLEARLQQHPDNESFFYIYRILIRLYIKTGRENDIDQLIDRFKIVNSKTLVAQIYEELGNAERAMEYRSKVTPPLALLEKPVPDFSATDLNGKPISLQQYRGKVVLLDFWAVWNSFCIGDILNVKKIYDTYKDQGFEVIGVSLDTDETKLRNYLKENDIPWRQIYSGQEQQCPLVKQSDVKSIPARWLIDRAGTLIAHEANHKLMSRKGREPDLERLVAAAVADKPKNQ
ncbi:TlpA family protein disulfide reductase [Candidatus Poribacteria bacterium]|nr:TlpA family protein disulfide reductase [Candidatus Poribacteria bacterium]MYK21409.1 TlpA family protein disulfide reductase [Candidatus Poribacteria bacterium]